MSRLAVATDCVSCSVFSSIISDDTASMTDDVRCTELLLLTAIDTDATVIMIMIMMMTMVMMGVLTMLQSNPSTN